MLAVMKRALLLLIPVILAGCAALSPRPFYIAGSSAMPNETQFTLYSETAIRLGPFQSADSTELWDRIGDEAQAMGTATLSWRFEFPVPDRVVRVVRTENGIPAAFHLLISEQRNQHGITLRLQPMVAWHRRIASEVTEAMPVATSSAILVRLRTELAAIAAAVGPQD